MPNRYVREAAIESEAVNSLSWQGEVFYRRLLNRVDDFGRYTANNALLRASIFPLQLDRVRDSDIPRLLAECEKAGLLFVYTIAAKQYFVINKWEKGRAKKSDYPNPPPDICERMQTFAYMRKHLHANAPDSDTDSDTDSDPKQERASEADKAGKTARPRDFILDALASVDGSDPLQITAAAWPGICKALADIRKVVPEVTPEEIHRRADNYRRHMPGARLTPYALAKHWAVCATADTSKSNGGNNANHRTSNSRGFSQQDDFLGVTDK